MLFPVLLTIMRFVSVFYFRFLSSIDAVCSAGWDKQAFILDPRQHTIITDTASTYPTPLTRLQLKGKAYALATQNHHMVIATTNREIHIYDLRNLSDPVRQLRESSFKSQTRCLAIIPDNSGWVSGCVEGRAAVDYFDSELAKSQYAFKCHRVTKNDEDWVYPVNAVAFHQTCVFISVVYIFISRYGSFVTGGADGSVCVWDRVNKKRIKMIVAEPEKPGVSALDFNAGGSYLIVGHSYTFERGDIE